MNIIFVVLEMTETSLIILKKNCRFFSINFVNLPAFIQKSRAFCYIKAVSEMLQTYFAIFMKCSLFSWNIFEIFLKTFSAVLVDSVQVYHARGPGFDFPTDSWWKFSSTMDRSKKFSCTRSSSSAVWQIIKSRVTQ